MRKLTRSHTTFLDAKVMEVVLEFLNRNKSVKSFTAGIIISKYPPSKNIGPVKIMITSSSLQISINTKRYKQEIRVYGHDLMAIAEGLGALLKKNVFSFKIVYT